MATIAGPEQGGVGPIPGGLMNTNWGASLAAVDKPAGTIMVTERFEDRSLCEAGGVHYKDFRDFVGGAYLRSVVPGLSVQVVSREGLLNQLNKTNPDEAYHQGGFNNVFADAHAKWLKYSQTVKYEGAEGSPVVWSMWDRRLAP